MKISITLFLVCVFSSIAFTQDLPELIPYRKGNKFGYVDQSKKVKIRFKYDDAGLFCNGIAWVKKKNKFSYVNEKGKLISGFLFDKVLDFDYEDEGSVQIINPQKFYNEWKRINKEGKILGQRLFQCGGFRACFLPKQLKIYTKNGKYGILRKENINELKYDTLFKERFDSIYYESVAGYLHVSEKNKWGIVYFDKEIITPQYDYIGNFFNDADAPLSAIIVTKAKKMGFIDNTGKEIVKPEFDHVFPFKGGLSRIILNNKPGYIDIKGNRYFE